MWYTGELILKSYLPFKLEEDMLFINRISVGIMDPYVELFMLEEIPEDEHEFMSKHGAPVELFIIDEDDEILATEENFGWWDEGDDTDELRNICLDDINYILRECEGYIDIEISDETEKLDVLLFEDKVILRIPQDVEE
jgi:hypothetical protein